MYGHRVNAVGIEPRHGCACVRDETRAVISQFRAVTHAYSRVSPLYHSQNGHRRPVSRAPFKYPVQSLSLAVRLTDVALSNHLPAPAIHSRF